MGLVGDQQIVLAGIDWFAECRQGFFEQPKGTFSFEKVDAGDEPGEMGPRVDVDSSAAAKITHQARIHDAEVEAELVPHLFPPLNLQSRGDDNQDLACSVTDDEFEGHHARFDGLAKPHIISDQQIDPRHLDRTHHGVKLVVFNFDATAKWRLDVLQVCG